MRLSKILLFISLLWFLTSCNKDFLNRSPQSDISSADYWQSTNDLKLYANNYYNTMLPSYTNYFDVGYFGEDANEGSDNMIGQAYNTGLNGETVVPSSGGGWNWSQLRDLNYFMANYQRVNAPWSQVKQYVGETLFFRSMFYFNMLKFFGDLPWITQSLTVTDTSNLYGVRLPRHNVVDSILNDLDSAISYLPSRGSSEPFRVDKQVAMLFESRVALYEGTWEKYHQGDPFGAPGHQGTAFLEKAAAVSEALINSGVQSLDNVGVEDGYWKLFNQTDYSNSNEIMLWRKYDVSAGVATHWYLYVPIGLEYGITKNLVDDYLCTDGKPISISSLYKGDDSLDLLAANRDPRLGQTIYLPGDPITTNKPNGAPNVLFQIPDFQNSAHPPTGYELFKGMDPDYSQQSTDFSTQALIYFRYAECLLNFAEAKAELGTITQSDLDKSINLLRARVNMPPLELNNIPFDPHWEFPNLSPIINEIRRERRVELACEGFRHDDIMRWAAAGKLIVGQTPLGAKMNQWASLVPSTTLSQYPVNAQGYIDPYKNISQMAGGYHFDVNRDYLLPIPLNQLTLNPKIKQNPGW